MQYITAAPALHALADSIQQADWVALDTEFMREKTYYPQLCLLQLATTDVIACVDPLALDDLTPLYDVLFKPGITKILHAARQDYEIFFHATGRLPAPLFDTQAAAGLAGFSDQAGYATLVKELLDVDLPKSHTRADWTHRPLADEVLAYAADDVRYLGALYDKLNASLAARGRRTWLDAELTTLIDPATYRPDPATSWKRIRGQQRLKPRELAVLAALAAWREGTAIAANRPRQWIVRDEILLDLARRQPRDLAALAQIRGIQTGFVERRGAEVLDLAQQARDNATPPAALAERERLTPEQDAVVDLLMSVARLCGAEQDISPANLVTRKEIERLVTGDRDLSVLAGWRRAAVGDALLDVLEGKRSLRLENGKAVLD